MKYVYNVMVQYLESGEVDVVAAYQTDDRAHTVRAVLAQKNPENKYWVRQSRYYIEPPRVPIYLCEICGGVIDGGAMVGCGDGSGSKFAHSACYDALNANCQGCGKVGCR